MTAVADASGNIIDTRQFTPGATRYMSLLARRWAAYNFWWLIMGPLIPAILAVWIPVCIFISLMIALLLYPGVLMLVYYKYALSPWSRLSVYTQQISISGMVMTRHFVPSDSWPVVPEDQVLPLASKDFKRVGDYMLADIQGHSRYEFVIFPADGMVFA